MVQSREDKVGYDQSATAEVFLDKILEDTSKVNIEKLKNQAGVEDELQRERLIKEASERVRSRVLFITQRTDVLEEGSLAQRHYINLQMVFDEIHVLVINYSELPADTKRISDKVWVYTAHLARSFFMTNAAMQTVKTHLSFADGFRPDIVVSLDPFESGLVGLKVAQKYERVFQVHIFEDYITPGFVEEKPENKKRLKLAKKTLTAAQSVRVESENMLKKLKQVHPHIADINMLPRFFNIKEIAASIDTLEKKRLFPQFSFVVLYAGKLDSDSALFRAVDAARRLLSTPSIGLIVVGDGPRKNQFIERTKILQIDSQIIFKKDEGNLIEYMQAADVMLLPDTSKDSEEVVVRAAAAGLPMVLARTSLRDDLFVDGQDVFLCDPEDTLEFTQKLTKFINTNSLRVQFAENARDVALTRIVESPEMYQLAYRDSIEAVLYLQQAAEVMKARTAELEQQRAENSESMPLTESVPTAPPPPDKKIVGSIEMKMPEN